MTQNNIPKKIRIIEAEQQLLGFALGSQGYSIEELVSSMNLEQSEWIYLKNKKMVNNLSEEQIKEVDDYLCIGVIK
jgi:hypothetical protein